MHVSKWGNSLAIRLPTAIVKALKLKEGDEIEVHIAGDRSFGVARDKRAEDALAKLRALRASSKPLPPGFRLNRDEANAR